MKFLKRFLYIYLIGFSYILLSYLFSYMAIQDDDLMEELLMFLIPMGLVPLFAILLFLRIKDSFLFSPMMHLVGLMITASSFLFSYLMIFDIITLFHYLLSFFITGLSPYLIYDHYIKIYAMLPLTGILLILSYINHLHVVINRKTITSSKIDGSVKIVAIADLHLGYGHAKNMLPHWVEKINKEKADIVLILGDIIDKALKPLLNKDLSKEFKRIQSTHGVYAVLGNHDEIEDREPLLEYLKESNIRFLLDESINLPHSITLIGRQDRGFIDRNNRKKLESFLGEPTNKTFNIVMDHQPEKNYSIIAQQYPDLDLFLSGHTHAGQFFPFNIFGRFFYEVFYGYKKILNLHAFVTQGLGHNDFFPYRLGTQSEILAIQVNSSKKGV